MTDAAPKPIDPAPLLEDHDEAAALMPRRSLAQERLRRLGGRLRNRARAGWRSRPIRYTVAALVLALGGAAGRAVYERVRFVPPPDYDTASMDVLFEYTLLTEDFNRLPVEERLELIRKLVERLRGITASDSVLMAMLASMIAGEARAQMEENVSRIAVDLFDSYADDYDRAAADEDREEFLMAKLVEFERTMEGVAGIQRDASDEERVAAAEREAVEQMDAIRSGAMGADEVLRVFDVLNNGIGQHATGHQKTRIASMMQDMVWTLRRNGAEKRAAED